MKTEGIKYAGSKLKLLPYIEDIITDVPDIKTALDGFSGTTRVAQMFTQKGYDTTSNDISVWSEVFGKCYLYKNNKPNSYYLEIINYLNSLQGYSGWFTETYGALEKKPFQIKNLKKLDSIREEIDKMDLCDVDKSVILTSLILALDKVDSTIGHFSSYLHDFSPRSSNDLKLELPNRFKVKTNNRVIRDDIFNTLSAYKFDLVYFDPPYGSNNEKMPSSRVRYNSYYHFWTTVILNDKPITFGKAGRREDSRDMVNPSVFEDKDKNVVLNNIRNLIEKSQCKYVMLSYSSEGRISRENIIDIINKYTKDNSVYEIDYRRNVMSRMKWTNEWIKNESHLNKEYIFLARK